MKKRLSLRIILRQMRIKGWLKNLFVFFAIIFSLELFNWTKLIQTVILSLSFCLVSSAVYIFNDINDAENDRKHAVKKNRPIASGQISIPFACILMICLMAAGLGLALWVNFPSFLILLSYVVINILYSKWLKTKAVIDCFCIAAGFVLRVMIGGTVVTDGVSSWMFLTVVSLSLFMAFGKRRGELCSYGTGETREVLAMLDMNFLNGIIFMCAGLTMAFYSLWTISQRPVLVYTVPVVLFIVIRYLMLVFNNHSESDPTTLILSDKTLIASCGICAFMIVVLLYKTQIF